MGDGQQTDATDKDQDNAAAVVSAEKVEAGKTAGGQSDGGKYHAGKTRGIIGIGRPRRKQGLECGCRPQKSRGEGEVGLTEDLCNQQAAAVFHGFGGGKEGGFGRVPQVMREHARPQPGKGHQQQKPWFFMGFLGAARIGRCVSQHGRSKNGWFE